MHASTIYQECFDRSNYLLHVGHASYLSCFAYASIATFFASELSMLLLFWQIKLFLLASYASYFYVFIAGIFFLQLTFRWLHCISRKIVIGKKSYFLVCVSIVQMFCATRYQPCIIVFSIASHFPLLMMLTVSIWRTDVVETRERQQRSCSLLWIFFQNYHLFYS